MPQIKTHSLIRHKCAKRKQSTDSSGSYKIQIRPKTKKTKTNFTPNMISSTDNSKAKLRTEYKGKTPLFYGHSNEPIISSQAKTMVLNDNNNNDEKLNVGQNTENARGTNSKIKGAGADDNEILEEANDIPDDDNNNGSDGEENNRRDSNGDDVDSNEATEESNASSDTDSGYGSVGDEGDSNSDDSDDEQAPDVSDMVRLQKMLSDLNNQISWMFDDISSTMISRVDNLDDRTNNFFSPVKTLNKSMDMIDNRAKRMNRGMVELVSRLDLARVMSNVNEFHDTIMRRLNLLEKTMVQAIDKLDKIEERDIASANNQNILLNNPQKPIVDDLPIADDNDRVVNDLNQSQADRNQQPPVIDPQQEHQIPFPVNGVQQEQDPPVNIPQENNVEGVNNNVSDIYFEVRQLIYVENIDYLQTANIY